MTTGARTGSIGYLKALRDLKRWTRERFDLAVDAPVMVVEAATTEPGFPPKVTVTSFWSKPHIRHEFRVFKPADEIAEADLPPGWMKDAIVADDNMSCNCC